MEKGQFNDALRLWCDSLRSILAQVSAGCGQIGCGASCPAPMVCLVECQVTEGVSRDNVDSTCTTFNQAILLTGAPYSASAKYTQDQTSAVILYNMALCMQLRAMQSPEGQQIGLLKALRLYDKALQLTQCLGSAYGLDLMLSMASLNNVAAIHAYFFSDELVQRCLHSLGYCVRVARETNDHLVLSQDLTVFQMNFTVLMGNSIKNAPAA